MDRIKSFVCDTEVPAYQKEAIEWLERYARTEPLKDLLKRYRFTEEEIAAYREKWAKWLKPKERTRKQVERGVH